MPQGFDSSQPSLASPSFGKPYVDDSGSNTGIREFDDHHSSSFNQNKDSYIHDPFGSGQPSLDFPTDIGDNRGSISYDDLRTRNRSEFKNV